MMGGPPNMMGGPPPNMMGGGPMGGGPMKGGGPPMMMGGAGGPMRNHGGSSGDPGPYGKGGKGGKGKGKGGGKGGKGKGGDGGDDGVVIPAGAGHWGTGRGSRFERAKNDYAQHFVDTGLRPANFIRDSDVEERFEEYPKLKELIEAADAKIAERSTEPT